MVVPFGAVEQHGPHLPLDTDAVLADRLGSLLAERLDALCAPTIRIGCSQHHLAFAGTLSLRPKTLQLILHDLVDSLGAAPAASGAAAARRTCGTGAARMFGPQCGATMAASASRSGADALRNHGGTGAAARSANAIPGRSTPAAYEDGWSLTATTRTRIPPTPSTNGASAAASSAPAPTAPIPAACKWSSVSCNASVRSPTRGCWRG